MLASSSTARQACRLHAQVPHRRVVRVQATADYNALKGQVVYKANSGDAVELLSLWQVREPPGQALLGLLAGLCLCGSCVSLGL